MKPVTTLFSTAMIAITLTFATTTTWADDSDDIAPTEVAISMHQALDIALAEVPGSATEAELEHEDGLAVWEITVIDAEDRAIDVIVDANSGMVVDQKMDDD